MKIRRVIATIALMSAWIAGEANAQTQVSIKPSLAAFPFTQRQLPDWAGTSLYTGLTVPGGSTIGTGNALGASSWFKRLDRTHYQMSSYRADNVNADLEIYLEVVNEVGAALAKKANATTEKHMESFDGKTNGAVMEMLKAYRMVRTKQVKAQKGVEAAWSEVGEAMAATNRYQAVVLQQDLIAENADLQKRRDAIMAQVKKAGWLKEVIGLVQKGVGAASDPTKLMGLVSDVAIDKIGDVAIDAINEALLNNVLIENWATLKEIDDRQAAITAEMSKAKKTERDEGLIELNKRLGTARLRLIQAEIDLKIVSVEGWDYIDRLASLERAKKSTDLFVTLQSYNYQIRRQAGAIRDHGLAYLHLLGYGAPGQAASLLKGIERDIAEVEGMNAKSATFTAGTGGDFATWLRRAESTRRYLTKHVEWYQAEQMEVMRNIGAVHAEKHMLLVDATVSRTLDLLKSTTDI